MLAPACAVPSAVSSRALLLAALASCAVLLTFLSANFADDRTNSFQPALSEPHTSTLDDDIATAGGEEGADRSVCVSRSQFRRAIEIEAMQIE